MGSTGWLFEKGVLSYVGTGGSGLGWPGEGGKPLGLKPQMVKLLLTFPQGHQGLKGHQKHVFNNFPCPELGDQADRNGGYGTSTRLAASELLLSPK